MSAWNSIKRIFKPIKTGFAPIVEFFSSTISVWMALLGIVLIVIAALKPWGLPDNYLAIFNSIGSAVLVGGVFGVLLKSLQYSYFFKRELSNIIYGDNYAKEPNDLVTAFRTELRQIIYGEGETIERSDVITAFSECVHNVLYNTKFLENRRDLKELWRNISVIVYNSRYPGISELIAQKVTEEYFPIDDNFYYDNFQENIAIDFVRPENEYIVATESIDLRVKPVDSSKEIQWGYSAELFKRPSDTQTNFLLDKIVINNVDRTTDYRPTTSLTADGKALIASLNVKLEGASEYDLRLELRKTYELALNRERDVKSSRFIKAPELHVKYPSDMEIKFVPVGTRQAAYEPKGKLPSVIWNVYKDLIFPNQGYRLVLSRR